MTRLDEHITKKYIEKKILKETMDKLYNRCPDSQQEMYAMFLDELNKELRL